MHSKTAKVFLVGAGPGDPGLLTLKGRACIEAADVLIYDYLAAKALLAHASPGAERIYVGKSAGAHTLTQEKINELIVTKAREGGVVTRLKGGDPFIFGRGGEEAEALQQAGIAFEVVPGVTSAIAAPAYAGIPLTHRDVTSTLAFITGHEDPNKNSSAVDWAALTRIGTLVFLMGVKNLAHIVKNLQQHGLAVDTPVALVRWGTTTQQVTLTGTLDTIVARVQAAGLKAPAIIVVGHVVDLRERLQWFEKRPLFGKTIVVTRARAQASDLVQQLQQQGAEVLEFPTIQIAPPDDWGPVDAAIARLPDYHWIVFTSVNAVSQFFTRLFAQGRDVRALHHIKTAAIGPVTAQRLRDYGLNTDILPQEYRAEAVVEAFANEDMNGQQVLLPRATSARPVLPTELRRMGAQVDELPVYITRTSDAPDGSLLDESLPKEQRPDIDMITFTSSSTVQNFLARIPLPEFRETLSHVKIAAIGPITAQTAREMGLSVDVCATTYTIPGLCAAIANFYSGNHCAQS